MSSHVGVDQGFVEFDESQVLDATAVTSQQITDRALRFLQSRGRAPFFLFVHYFDPHGTYVDHAGFDFANHYTGWLRDEAHTEKQHLVVQSKRHLLGPAEYAYIRDLYDEEVAYTDSHIGRLLAYLDETGMRDSTLLVFVSDHGEEFWEHGGLGHRTTLYQEVIRVPLVVVDPSLPARSVVRGPVETRWLFRTILDVLGVRSPLDEASCPSLLGRHGEDGAAVRSSTHPVLRAEDLGADSGARVWLSCVIRGRWKLISDHLLRRTGLYDIESDPAERRDVIRERPDLGSRLAATLEALDAEVARGSAPAAAPEPDDEQIRRLRSLGYL